MIDDLPGVDHVVRYVKPASIEADGSINGSEFRLRTNRPDEFGVSINWLECFGGTKDHQVAEVRRLRRTKWKASGCLAELNVGQTLDHVRGVLPAIAFVHDPLEALDSFEADPSHAEIRGLPGGDNEDAELIGDMIAECIIDRHTTV